MSRWKFFIWARTRCRKNSRAKGGANGSCTGTGTWLTGLGLRTFIMTGVTEIKRSGR